MDRIGSQRRRLDRRTYAGHTDEYAALESGLAHECGGLNRMGESPAGRGIVGVVSRREVIETADGRRRVRSEERTGLRVDRDGLSRT